jgi:hypothetical protein
MRHRILVDIPTRHVLEGVPWNAAPSVFPGYGEVGQRFAPTCAAGGAQRTLATFDLLRTSGGRRGGSCDARWRANASISWRIAPRSPTRPR